MFGAHFLQNIFAGAVASCFCLFDFLFDLETVEKDLTDLFRRVDVEFYSCQFVDLFFQLVQFAGQYIRRLLQGNRVELDTCFFHFCQYIY